MERSDEYTSVAETYQYKHWCGVPLGTPEKPINGSPFLVKEEVIDWHQLFEIILKSLEECNLTWKFEKWTRELGQVPKEDIAPTPIFSNKYENTSKTELNTTPTPTNNEPPKQIRPCSICTKHVNKGTGLFYKHKLVHKDECLELAKAKWGAEETQ